MNPADGTSIDIVPSIGIDMIGRDIDAARAVRHEWAARTAKDDYLEIKYICVAGL